MKTGFGQFRDKLLDKPDVTLFPFCAICGRPARDKHHVIQKGMGGVTPETDRRIPLMRLCGDGNETGCHGLLHQGYLHIYWEEGRPGVQEGWVFLFTPTPIDDFECWELNRAAYLPVPGWLELIGALDQYWGIP